MSRSTSKVIAALAMSNETPENKTKRAAALRKQADASEAESQELDEAGKGTEAIEMRAQATRQRELAKLVEPKKPKGRSRKPDQPTG